MTNWPIAGQSKLLAWAPNVPGPLAVPLKPTDQDMTWEKFLNRLGQRIAWMAEQQDNPSLTVAELWEEKLGDFLDLPKDLSRFPQHPAFQSILMSRYGLSQGSFPQPVESQKDCVNEILELNSLWDWLVTFLPDEER